MSFVSDLSFSPDLQRLISREPITSRGGRVFRLYPTSSENNLIVLRNLFLELKPEQTLETGLAVAGSAIALAMGHRELGRAPTGQHIAIDPRQTHPNYYDSIGLDNIDRAGLTEYVRFIEGCSHLVLPDLMKEGVQVGLVYIDGSHLFEDVFVDFYYANHLLSENGVVCFDDCTLPDVHKIVRFIDRNFKGHLKELDLSPYRADGGRSLRYTAAKAAGRQQLRAFTKEGPTMRRFKAPFQNF